MKKTLEKKTIIFTMLATCLCGFCFRAEAAVPFHYSRTIGIGYLYNGEEVTESRAVTTYDEQGRVSQYEIRRDGAGSMAAYSYEEDDHGKVCRIIEDGEARTEFVLENHYDGAELTEAVVTDVLVDGQSRREDLQLTAPDYDAADSFYRIETVLFCLKYYDGYENNA